MKPNQLVNQMVNDAKVEPTPKPTIPEKPKDSVGYKSPKLKATEEKLQETVQDAHWGRDNDGNFYIQDKNGKKTNYNSREEAKSAYDKMMSTPSIRDQWESWKRMKDTGSDYSIKKNNKLLNAVSEGIKPYLSPEEHDKWLGDSSTWSGEQGWLDDTEKYLKRIDDNELYNPYKHKRRVARNFEQYDGLLNDYENSTDATDYYNTLDEKKKEILDSAFENSSWGKNDKDETLGMFISNNDLINKYPKDEDYLKAIEPYISEHEKKYNEAYRGSFTPRDELNELAQYYRRYPQPAYQPENEKGSTYLNYVQSLLEKGMSPTEAYDMAEEQFDRTNNAQPRTKVASLKERVNNSTNMLSAYIDAFYADDTSKEGLTPQQKANKLIDEFKNYYQGYRDNYQDRFGQFLLDYGVTPIYYDDIYKDLVKIGYLDDPKYLEEPEKMMKAYSFNMMKAIEMKAYSFNMMKAIEKLAGRKIYQ